LKCPELAEKIRMILLEKNCTRTLTNELGEKYNWLGQKQKRKFSCLKFSALLFGKNVK